MRCNKRERISTLVLRRVCISPQRKRDREPLLSRESRIKRVVRPKGPRDRFYRDSGYRNWIHRAGLDPLLPRRSIIYLSGVLSRESREDRCVIVARNVTLRADDVSGDVKFAR